MADLRFKIQQLDAGAAHWLGWAKKEVLRLAELMPAFTRTWQHGDVTVRAQYHEESGIARLWLAAAETERLAVWATLPNPHAARRIFVYTRPATNALVVASYNPSQYPRPGYVWIHPNGSHDEQSYIYAQWLGYADFVVTSRPDPDFPERTEWVNTTTYSMYPSLGAVYNGEAITYQYHPPENNVVATAFSLMAEYQSALVEAQSFSIPKQVQVLASSGELLASQTVVVEGDNERYIPVVDAWNGGDFCTLFERANVLGTIEYTYHSTLRFEVPEDCVYAHDAMPVYPGTDGGEDLWLQQWEEALQQFNQRSYKWSREKTTEIIASMQTGTYVLPHEWSRVLKQTAPKSVHTYFDAQMSETVSDEVVSDTSVNLTQNGTKVVKRSATLSYSIVDEGVTTERSTTLIGTLTQDATEHTNGAGIPIEVSVKDTYENWYERAGPEALLPELYYAYANDDDGKNYGAVLNGVFQGGRNADSSYGSPDNPVLYNEYVPVYPVSENSAVMTLSGFVADFFASQRPRYKKDAGNRNWLSSALTEGSTIIVIPVSRMVEEDGVEVDTGMFAVEQAGKVKIFGAALYKYDRETGYLGQLKWVPLPSGALDTTLVVPDDYELRGNVLLIYGGIKWDDVKETARAQRKALNDPNDPAHDPFMKAVLDALKSPEPPSP